MRKVLSIVTRGETQQGNPRIYWYLFECGHVQLFFHRAVMSMDMFSLKQDLEVKRMCDARAQCSQGYKRPLSNDKEKADDLFPYRITIPLYEALMKEEAQA
jgi:hypothetical protein